MAELNDGYQTLIRFEADPDRLFREKTVTPPGVDGGGEIDTTTMLNETVRTRSPKALFTVTNASLTVAYDPNTIVSEVIANLLNVNNLITVTFPDGHTIAFWGWLNKFTPNEHQEGEQPTAEIEIIPSNQNDSGEETLPVYT